jgi:hypothetical protein
MPKSSKGNVKAGQRGRADEKNGEAIWGLLRAAEAERTVADRTGRLYTPDPLLTVTRITGRPSNEWFSIIAPSGRVMQVQGLDKGIAHIVSQMCKQCKQTQAGSESWPVVIVSLPEPNSSKKTGEILAVLDAEAISQFAELGFSLRGIGVDSSEAAGGGAGGFVFTDDLGPSSGEEVNIDAI